MPNTVTIYTSPLQSANINARPPSSSSDECLVSCFLDILTNIDDMAVSDIVHELDSFGIRLTRTLKP